MKTKKRMSKKWFLLLMVILLLIPVVAYAQPAGGSTGASADLYSDILRTMVGVMSTLLRVLRKILWPVLLLIGGLLNNDLIFGSGVEERLLGVWTQVRNIVNVMFIVVLVGVAIYNVFGRAKEGLDIKSFLPKFAIALIAVNFSYIAGKMVLDVTNVATVAMFSLPTAVGEGLQASALTPEKEGDALTDSQKTKMKKICENIYGTPAELDDAIINKRIPTRQVKNASGAIEDKPIVWCNVSGNTYDNYTSEGFKYFRQFSSRNAGLVLGVQMMNLIEVDSASLQTKAKGSISTLAFDLVFAVILYIVYGTAYIALAVLLIIRLVAMWLMMALSPLIALAVVIPKEFMPAGDLKSRAITYIIAPIKIGFFLTIGFILLSALKDFKGTLGNVPTKYEGAIPFMNLNSASLSDLHAFVIAAGAVAVVWMGVFSAAEGTFAGRVIGSIRDKVGSYGKRIAGLYKFLPIFPTQAGKGGNLSIAGITGKIDSAIGNFERRGKALAAAPPTNYAIKNFGKNSKVQLAEAQRFLQSTIPMIHRPGAQKAVVAALENLKRSDQPSNVKRGAENLLRRIGPRLRTESVPTPEYKRELQTAFGITSPRTPAAGTTRRTGATGATAPTASPQLRQNTQRASMVGATIATGALPVSSGLQQLHRQVTDKNITNQERDRRMSAFGNAQYKEELENIQKARNAGSPDFSSSVSGIKNGTINPAQINKAKQAIEKRYKALVNAGVKKDYAKKAVQHEFSKALGGQSGKVMGVTEVQQIFNNLN